MRTTVRVDQALLDRARRETAARGMTLTALIEQGLRLALWRPMKMPDRPPVSLPVSRAGGGTCPGVDLAWFAALAIESGCEWITTDRDYARFPGLAWRPPL